MLILAFDTSGFAGSVALLEGPQVLGEETLDRERRSTQTLAPAIVRLMAGRGITANRIGLVATTIGPGSFTGLRMGVTTAKAMAYAMGAEVIGLGTLEVLAAQTPRDLLTSGGREIHAVLDAQRKELFFGRFAADAAGTIGRIAGDAIVSGEEWLDMLPASAIVTGTGVNKWVERLPAGVSVVAEKLREPLATTVGRLAWAAHGSGRRDDLWKLAPVYLRASYAEEKVRGAQTT